ncbi:hypothetical protein PPMP20_26595 [Paraburkholderia phymatum]|uniref:Uncharacterized protein n=1 Tax=Paraburkholderia phymatum (strain DSM 17167 / CIP 108236 / LMG 21445 / STM815) TaxID=391038 RepID=B2JL42_PARP8|nr:hypothetical protein [Paraburkholderia phymatum]ACC72571.1 conserved hypothetical protein [Paraburkholderia phymatum STM815]
MKSIEQRWHDFSTFAIPHDAPPVQFHEMRKAFYAGFKSMLDVDCELAELTDEDAIVLLDSYYHEAHGFLNGGLIISIVRER